MADGSGKASIFRFLDAPVSFHKISFLILALLFMRKVDNRKIMGGTGKKEKENNDANIATNVIASWPPERWLTETLPSRAKTYPFISYSSISLWTRRMKIFCLAIYFLQLVCSKHFLVETGDEDTKETHRETKDMALNYHGKYDFLGGPRAADDYTMGLSCLGRKCCGKNKIWSNWRRKCVGTRFG